MVFGRERVAVGDYVDARVNRALRSLWCLHVPFDFAAAFCSFADRQPDVGNRVPPRLAVDAELDGPRPEQHILADRFDDLVRAVGIDVLRKDDVVLLVHLGRRPELPARAADNRPRRDHGRPRQPSLLDRLPQRSVGVERVVAYVADDGKAGA